MISRFTLHIKIQRLQNQLSCEQAKMKKKENEVQYLQQELMITREQAMNEEKESVVHELQMQVDHVLCPS